jgi:hypothetical protein
LFYNLGEENTESVFTRFTSAVKMERLVFTVINVFKRPELSTEEKVAWLETFTLEVQKALPMPDPEGYRKFINVKHFLRTLYFELLRAELDDKQKWLEKIQALLKNYSKLQ